MKYTAKRVCEMVDMVPWDEDEDLRIFWVRLSEGSREKFSESVNSEVCSHARVCVILRSALFLSANSVLSDVNKLIAENRRILENISSEISKVTIIILSRDDFQLPQISSPIVLPEWFPVLEKRETSCRISDLSQRAEADILNCQEIRADEIAAHLYELESTIVRQLTDAHGQRDEQLTLLMSQLFPGADGQKTLSDRISGFERHLASISDPRAYRPSTQKSPSLLGQLLRIVSRSSPADLVKCGDLFSRALGDNSENLIRPSIFSLSVRPSSTLSAFTRNWHSIITSLHQGYQILNASAHAGDYGSYPIALLYNTSVDLRRSLQDGMRYIETLQHNNSGN